jgi:hypothetical protein
MMQKRKAQRKLSLSLFDQLACESILRPRRKDGSERWRRCGGSATFQSNPPPVRKGRSEPLHRCASNFCPRYSSAPIASRAKVDDGVKNLRPQFVQEAITGTLPSCIKMTKRRSGRSPALSSIREGTRNDEPHNMDSNCIAIVANASPSGNAKLRWQLLHSRKRPTGDIRTPRR